MTPADLPPPTQPAIYACNKCGYFGEVGESHCIGHSEKLCNYLAAKSGPYWDESAVRLAVRQALERAADDCAAAAKKATLSLVYDEGWNHACRNREKAIRAIIKEYANE